MESSTENCFQLVVILSVVSAVLLVVIIVIVLVFCLRIKQLSRRSGLRDYSLYKITFLFHYNYGQTQWSKAHAISHDPVFTSPVHSL